MQRDNTTSGAHGPAIPEGRAAQARLRAELENRGVLVMFHQESSHLEELLIETAGSFYNFFHLNGYQISKKNWQAKKISDKLSQYFGWVYAFYAIDDEPLYIGETGQTFISRFNQHKGKKYDWWSRWDKVKVLPCPNQGMRKVFESIIGLNGGYRANKSQPPAGDNLFDDVILSLLLLGNDNQRLPTFPQK